MGNLPFSKKVTFIKCDVEEAEIMVFKGGRTLLARFHPVILCEVVEKYTKRYGYSPEEVFGFLKELGYQSFIFDSKKLMPTEKYIESIENYIFISNDKILDIKYKLDENFFRKRAKSY